MSRTRDGTQGSIESREPTTNKSQMKPPICGSRYLIRLIDWIDDWIDWFDGLEWVDDWIDDWIGLDCWTLGLVIRLVASLRSLLCPSIVPTTMAAAARDIEVEIERPAEDRKEQILRHQAAIASLLDDWMAEIEREKLQLQQAKGPSRATDGRQP